MTFTRAALALPCLPLLLLACSAPTTPVPVVVCPQSVSTGLSASSLQTPGALSSLGVAQAVAAASPVAANWSAPHVAGRVLVTTGAGSGAPSLRAQSLEALGAVSVQTVMPGLLRVATPTGQSDQVFAAGLRAAGLHVQPDYLYRALATPDDPGAPGNKGITVATAQGTKTMNQTYLTRIAAPQAWAFLRACGKTPAAASTAMLDTAVDTTHPELQGRIVNQMSYLPSTFTQTQDHGTATTGVLGATTNNGAGLAGLTWSGPVVSVEVLGAEGTSTSAVAQGVNYAVQKGAKVINMSLGAAGITSDSVLDAALTAAANSAVLVAAAGNTPGDGVYYPASHPDVIAVGAVGVKDSVLACYSARPSAKLPRKLDIVAPGGASYGTCAGTVATDDLLLLAPGGGYALEAGTSFSAPLVSGVAALMRAANPALTAAQTKTLLLGSVNSAGGLPLLDANAAVQAATH
ncbi:peptidase S8 [Deinococcus sp. KSM4-11]|uniref:S8 family peptidase n=1 Tax=Deinococcus sp. KSM4-11 TaxID=2568654 RepID=UPI0010A58E87|nr:S8 family serine peptidase [Deinococcus sp. KSM4-11]THF85862.1 peptidase S8 [Deinococcus sp. KSM4-11]